MAHTPDLRVVAEGVENDAQPDLLVGMGGGELQGYLFAKPITATSLALWAESDTSDGREALLRPWLFGATQPAPLDS